MRTRTLTRSKLLLYCTTSCRASIPYHNQIFMRSTLSQWYCQVDLNKLSPTRSDPQDRPEPDGFKPAHEPYWTGPKHRSRCQFLARVQPKNYFCAILHYKLRGRLARPQAHPKKLGPTYLMRWSWTGLFWPEITKLFSVSPAKCSDLLSRLPACSTMVDRQRPCRHKEPCLLSHHWSRTYTGIVPPHRAAAQC